MRQDGKCPRGRVEGKEKVSSKEFRERDDSVQQRTKARRRSSDRSEPVCKFIPGSLKVMIPMFEKKIRYSCFWFPSPSSSWWGGHRDEGVSQGWGCAVGVIPRYVDRSPQPCAQSHGGLRGLPVTGSGWRIRIPCWLFTSRATVIFS